MYDDEEVSSDYSGSEGRRYSQEDLISEPVYDAGANFLVIGGNESRGSSRYLDEDQIKVLDRDLQRQKQETVLK